MSYLLHVCTVISIYMILCIALDLVVGYLGCISISQAAFFGIGAYTAAIMSLRLSTPFGVTIICSAFVGGLMGALFAAALSRFREDHFIIGTFCFQVIVFSSLNNLVEWTGGPMGLSGIPRPTVGQMVLGDVPYLCFTSALAALTFAGVQMIVRSPYGRLLTAVREDPVLVMAMGKNVTYVRVSAFVIASAFAGLGGGVYAHYASYIDPTSFTLLESILMLSIVIIGGAASPLGPVVGALLLVGLPELFRFAGLPASVGANLRQIVYGLALVLVLAFRPTGVFGQHSLTAPRTVAR